MKVYTFLEAYQKIQREMDIEEEDFVDVADLQDFFNEAIDEAEAIILNLREDYFLTSEYITLVSGQADYSLPTDIYANKIRLIYYDDGNKRYPIKRAKLEETAYLDKYGDSGYYMYTIQNDDAVNGPKIVFHPASTENSSQNAKIWYIRNANRVENSTDRIDIPEFMNFIWAYVKKKIAEKEANPLLAQFMADLEKQEARMRVTLDEMVMDNDQTIDPDISFYNDFMDEDHWGAY